MRPSNREAPTSPSSAGRGVVTEPTEEPVFWDCADCEEGGPLRAVLDALQEPFGNPEEPLPATSAMLEAERVFVEAVVAWLREHDPERLADIEKAKDKP